MVHGPGDGFFLDVGDYVEAFGYHDDVAARNVVKDFLNSFMVIHRLS